MPYLVSLNSLNGTTLVKEAYFTLSVGGSKLTPVNGEIVTLNNGTFAVTYGLMDQSSTLQASMEVIYSFSEGQAPEILSDRYER